MVRLVVDGDGTVHLDSRVQAGGGHPGHLEGGAETLAILNSQLVSGIQQLQRDIEMYHRLNAEMQAELDRIRTCPNCGVRH